MRGTAGGIEIVIALLVEHGGRSLKSGTRCHLTSMLITNEWRNLMQVKWDNCGFGKVGYGDYWRAEKMGKREGAKFGYLLSNSDHTYLSVNPGPFESPEHRDKVIVEDVEKRELKTNGRKQRGRS